MKRLLIVVDYQRDFVEGALGFPGAEALDGPIADRIAAYRAAGDDVAFTLDTHGPDYPATEEGQWLPAAHCLRGSPGWSLYGRTGEARRPEDPVFEKETFPSLALGEDRQVELLHMNLIKADELLKEGTLPKPTADALKLACRGAEGGVKKNVLLPAGEEHVLLLEALGQRVMGVSVTP